MRFGPERMIENAAVASQCSAIESPVIAGAILRSVCQWVNHNRDVATIDELMDRLKSHPDYDR